MRVSVAGEASDDAIAGESVQWDEEAAADDVVDLGPIDAAADGLDAVLGEEVLDWQPELDSALEAIDSCLPVKRRRATDPPGTAFPRPEVSVLTFTPEMLDALASRVADKLKPLQAPPRPPVFEEPRMKPGAVISIRFRWPLFSFRSARGKRWLRARA